MRRNLLGILFVLFAAAAVAGGFWLERSGTAQQSLQAALDQLPAEELPLSDLPGEGTGTPDRSPADDPSPSEDPSPAATPDVVQADSDLDAPVGTAFYWGVHQPQAPYELAALDTLAGDVGEEPAIVMWYQEWAGSQTFPSRAAADVLERGAVPMITWEAWEPPAQDPSLEPEDARGRADQPAFRLSRIVEGEYDDYLRGYAEQVAAFGGPVMLRPFHEMNGFWYPWGGTVNQNEPADVVSAWRHVHAVFEAAGADNVTWVWSVNHRSLPDSHENSIDVYWPGADTVDWIGVSGFNFGDTSPVSSWLSFSAIYGDVLAQLEQYDKPVALAEFATVPSGGDEAVWIADAFARLRQDHPQVGAVVWFDREMRDVRDFRIGATPQMQRAFRTAIDDVGVLAAPTALDTTTSRP